MSAEYMRLTAAEDAALCRLADLKTLLDDRDREITIKDLQTGVSVTCKAWSFQIENLVKNEIATTENAVTAIRQLLDPPETEEERQNG